LPPEEGKRVLKKINIILSFVFMALGAFVIVLTLDAEMPRVPAAFQRGLAALLIFLAFLLLVFSFFDKKSRSDGEKEQAGDNKLSHLPVILCMILVLIYCLTIETVGYIISTIFLVAGTIYVLGHRNFVVIFSVAFGVTFFIFVVFTKIFLVPLPIGSMWG